MTDDEFKSMCEDFIKEYGNDENELNKMKKGLCIVICKDNEYNKQSLMLF